MTREEELDWLYRLRSEIYVYMPVAWIVPMNNAVDMAINELAKGPILDKIRAEIEQNAYPIVHGVNNRELGMTLYGILEVIDKYKTESEDEEC